MQRYGDDANNTAAFSCENFSSTNYTLSSRRQQQLAPYMLKCDKKPLNNKLGPPDFYPKTPNCPEETLTREYVQTGFKETLEGVEEAREIILSQISYLCRPDVVVKCKEAASGGSTSHTGYPGAGLKEELYQMNKTLKDQYLAGLGDLCEISLMLHGDNQMPTQKPTNLLEEVNFKLLLERSLHSLQITKRPSLEDSVPMYKGQICSILNSHEVTCWNPGNSLLQKLRIKLRRELCTKEPKWLNPSQTLHKREHFSNLLDKSPERSNVKRLRPSLEDDIQS